MLGPAQLAFLLQRASAVVCKEHTVTSASALGGFLTWQVSPMGRPQLGEQAVLTGGSWKRAHYVLTLGDSLQQYQD